MIELAGTRYAAGKATSAAMWAVTALACTSYALLLGDLAINVVCWRHFDWMDLLSTTAGLLYPLYLTAGLIVAQVLLASDSQPVVPTAQAGRTRTKALWNSQALVFLRARPVKMTFAIIITLVIGRYWIVPMHNRLLYALYVLVVAVLIARHSTALYRISRHMRREAATPDNSGRTNKKRGWDWDRYKNTDEQGFRSRFGAWTPPITIKHPAEAADYATRVRRWRFMWMGINAVLIVLLTVLASQPIDTQVHAIAHAVTHLTEPPQSTSMLQHITFPLLVFVLLLPTFIQYRIAEYNELARLYDDRSKELLVKKASPRTIVRHGRQSLSRHHIIVAGNAHSRLIRQPT